uniref:Protein kinase domain-containing protein n=1 Tax=Lates calcarifer TaxID=8187 RepID=A0A4W6DWB9_LATCA
MSTSPGLGAPDLAEGPQSTGPVGLQTLLDLLVGVYQEFYSSPFAREKYVSGFLQWAEPLVRQVKKTRIKREDFHILKVIGRGTFSEVRSITTEIQYYKICLSFLKKASYKIPRFIKVYPLQLINP